MEERQSSIAPPPSLDDILSSTPDSRLGQVDFTSRLAPEPEPEPEVEAEQPEDAEVDSVEDDGSAEDSDPASEPSVMPVARLEDLPIPARESVDDADEVSPTDTAEADLAPDDVEPATHSADYSEEQALYDELAKKAESERPQPEVSAPSDDLFAATTTAAAPAAPLSTSTAARPVEQSAVKPPAGGAELDYLGLSVDEVAASVIARMREAGEASRRHLESIEGEAARRCELLTAQAELDAELIRLHARREAHAIITAARSRAGAGTAGSDADSARLNEIGETFSRFAESIETTVAEAPQSPDHPHRP